VVKEENKSPPNGREKTLGEYAEGRDLLCCFRGGIHTKVGKKGPVLEVKTTFRNEDGNANELH